MDTSHSQHRAGDPPAEIVALASSIARLSPCRSRRGVVLWDPLTRTIRGTGFNGPPRLRACPGRDVCAGTCGQRSVHAEVRAICAVRDVLKLTYNNGGSRLVELASAAIQIASTALRWSRRQPR